MSRHRSDVDLERKLEQARAYFREHHAGVEPDAGFADRVAARLDRDASEVLGWAAWRLLPATVALTVLLLVLSLRVTPEPATVAAEASDGSSDDLLGWVLEEPENGS